MAAMKISLKDKVSAPSPSSALSQLFGSGDGGIVELPIGLLDEITDQPYRLYTQEELEELAADIQMNGILNPILVQPMGERYQILSGRNRTRAAKMMGMSTVPARIKDVDAISAELMLHSTNLFQRHDLRPSEKAKGYKRYLELVDEITGGAEDGVHIVHSKDKLAAIAKMADSSRRNVSYYLRLAELDCELLKMVDDDAIPVRAGVEISYLNAETQQRLLEFLAAYPVKIDIAKAQSLREMSIGGDLSRTGIESILRPNASEVGKQRTRAIKIRSENVARYFPGKSDKQIVQEILRILEKHFEAEAGN